MNQENSNFRSTLASYTGYGVAGMSLYYVFRWLTWVKVGKPLVFAFPELPLSNTLLFLTSAICLIALEGQTKWIVRVLGLCVTVISALDFIKDLFGVGIDFDLLLSSFFYSDHQRHFMRLAPNSSIAFIFMGQALFFLGKKERKESSTLIANIFGGFTAALGLVSLFGYSAKVVSAYTWRNFAGMSIYTAGLFTVIGITISLLALERVSLRQRRVHVPILIVLSLLAITFQLYRAQSEAELRSIQQSTTERAASISDQFIADLDGYVGSFIGMGRRWNLQDGTPYSVWRGDTDEHLNNLMGITHFCWIDRNGKSQWCEPQPEMIFVPQNTLQLARQSEQEVGIELEFQGSSNFSVMVPVKKHGRYDGVLFGVISLERMFSRGFDFSHYTVTILSDTNQILYSSSAELPNAEWTKILDLHFRGVSFKLSVTPVPGQLAKFQSKIPFVVLFIGILFSLAIGYASYLMIVVREDARRSQDRLVWEQAISVGSDLIFVSIDKLGLVKSFNPAAEKFFAYEASEVIDRATPLIWHDRKEIEDYAAKVSLEVGQVIPPLEAMVVKSRSGNVDRNEWTFITKTGRLRKGELSVHALRGTRDDIIGYVGIVRDITEQREAESKLVQSSKMASLGEMAGGVAHEINNPLTIVQGRTVRLMQLLERPDGITPAVLQEQLNNILEMSRRIARIVKGLATFSRDAENDEFEPADLHDIIEDTLEFCRERFNDSNVSLVVKSAPDEILSCRPTQISQVLLNLLNNAFDAVKSLDEKWVKLEVSYPLKDCLQIRITDSGHRISEEVASKMMEPFFTTKDVGKGTGLGLSISKGIVESHQGKIFLDRDSLHTSFVVEFPK